MKRGLLYKKERYNLYLFKKNYKKKIKLKKNRIENFNDFKILLKKKKAIKIIYGIRNKQFKIYIDKLNIKDYSNLDKLFFVLEKRIDSFLFRIGIYSTRLTSRKQIVHKNVKVNNKTLNKPSYILKITDTITIKNIKNINNSSEYFECINNEIKIKKFYKIKECDVLKKI
ncbi:S4 domain-containing protein [Candidatus Vidania fulgoroideorum]